MKAFTDATPSLGCDFIAADNSRITCFQLVSEEKGRKVAIATIDLKDGQIYRELVVERLKPYLTQIRRLAKSFLAKSNTIKFGLQKND